ncbi:MAG TPA: hypothetical protein VFW06_11510 [Acidimicrobiia bacterium]|nr:hypothetical protein [Acidimicrobiia bacterium]
MSRRRARPAPTARIAAVVVVVLAATACAGGERLGAPAFRKQADAQCAKLAAASEELGLAQSEGATGEEVQGYVRAAADGLRDLTRGLADLRAPESLESGADALVAALDDYADGLDEIASRVEPGQGLTEALSAAPKLVGRLNKISERATDLVVALGLDGCQLA